MGKRSGVLTEKVLEDLRNDVEDLKREIKIMNCSHNSIQFIKGDNSSMGIRFCKTCNDCGKVFGVLFEKVYLKERQVILKDELKEIKRRMQERGDA